MLVAKLRPSRPESQRLSAAWASSSRRRTLRRILHRVPMFGGTWWDASFVFGSIADAGIVGLCISSAADRRIARKLPARHETLSKRVRPRACDRHPAPRLRPSLRLLPRRVLLHRLRASISLGDTSISRRSHRWSLRWLTAPLGYRSGALRFLPAILLRGVTVLLAAARSREELRGGAFAQTLTG